MLERAKKVGSTEPGHYLLPACRYRHTKEGKRGRLGFDPTRPMQGWRTPWRTFITTGGLKRSDSPIFAHHRIIKMAEAGVPDQTLVAIVGRVSKAMPEHYGHLRMNAKRKAVAASGEGRTC